MGFTVCEAFCGCYLEISQSLFFSECSLKILHGLHNGPLWWPRSVWVSVVFIWPNHIATHRGFSTSSSPRAASQLVKSNKTRQGLRPLHLEFCYQHYNFQVHCSSTTGIITGRQDDHGPYWAPECFLSTIILSFFFFLNLSVHVQTCLDIQQTHQILKKYTRF